MGSVSPYDPTMDGGRYLIGVVGEDDCAPLTKEEWEDHLGRPCRTDELVSFQEQYGNDPKAKLVIHGKGRKSTALNRAEASVERGSGIASFSSKD
jgi:hypothetical protein